MNIENKDLFDLYIEVYYLRYILSRVVESSEEIKSKINNEVFKQAKDFACQEMIKFMKSKHEKNNETS